MAFNLRFQKNIFWTSDACSLTLKRPCWKFLQLYLKSSQHTVECIQYYWKKHNQLHYFRDSTGSIEPIPTTETSIWNDRCVMFLNFELKFGTLFEDPYQRCYPLPSFLLKIACKEIVFDLENHNGSRGGRRRLLASASDSCGWFSNHL